MGRLRESRAVAVRIESRYLRGTSSRSRERRVELLLAEIDPVRLEVEREDAPVLLFFQTSGRAVGGMLCGTTEVRDVGDRLELSLSVLRGSGRGER